MKKILSIIILGVLFLVPLFAFAEDIFVLEIDYSVKENSVTTYDFISSNQAVANYFLDMYYDSDESVTQAIARESDGTTYYEVYTHLTKVANEVTSVKTDNSTTMLIYSLISEYFTIDDMKHVIYNVDGPSAVIFRIEDIEALDFIRDDARVACIVNKRAIEVQDFATFKKKKQFVIPVSVFYGAARSDKDVMFSILIKQEAK